MLGTYSYRRLHQVLAVPPPVAAIHAGLWIAAVVHADLRIAAVVYADLWIAAVVIVLAAHPTHTVRHTPHAIDRIRRRWFEKRGIRGGWM
jgi:hypothetical protein